MKSSELEAMSVEERVSCFYCAFGVDFIGANVALSEALIAPEAVPTYLQYLEGPNRDAWLLTESVLIPFAQGKAMKDEQQRLLVNFEVARRNCDVLSAAGAIPIFAQHLARAMLNLKGLNFQYMDIDQIERLFGQLNRALTMLYLTIVLSPDSVCLERSLFELGVCQPKQVLFDIFDCLQAHYAVAGFPLKRIMLLLYAWITPLEIPTKLQCKSIKRLVVVPIAEPVSDPLYVAKVKAQNQRDSIYASYIHKPHHDIAPATSTTDDPTFDQEWGHRVELVYRTLLLPNAKEIMSVFASVLAAGTNPDKRHVFGKRGSADASSYENNSQTNVSPEEQAYLTYMLREKAILMDATSLTLLTLLKHIRASHLLKAEYLASHLVDAGVLPTMTKFLNRDFATYVQVPRREAPESQQKLTVVVAMDDASSVAEYARQQLRCVASVLRLVQRLTKRKPSLIKSTLCRSQSLVWLKRVLNLKEPMTRLYALKLVKSQARYLGHQWVRKFTCVHLLTEVYLYVRPELEDDWLRSEDDDTSVTSAPKPVETLLAGEVQAYHHKHYWDRLKTSPSASNVSIVVQGMQDLEADVLDVEGGSCRKLFAELKLDTGTCQQYEKWLDIQGLMADADAPLPIAFG
ncbi:hypothetical protein SPRG_05602 [Saprolegnia parasitica CBS 223.65]|uniref:Far11/STRP C-terminal domain-containing protein n=1 Tax=Saprolegnia parasitica (strain CBS 223.65) TaxID=695850 RepID=A0A067CKC2_SAPPC|nr:hypothetical protein SPRG_05602 [Saprolegnia parasitica CBS 223.65]KDO29650.1 hypothetical protein SPRG_05602 [Saprolegnia parasitica CBS 223.65]|eukprot:XP_012199709.1 hypothetical protein SPRG_05602 [Saprolegnia parasitica CBS 223.65]